MNQYELIRTAHRVYGKGIREIGRETGHHRDTIRRAIAGIEPVYQRKKTPRSPVMDPFANTVEQWLTEDRSSPKKQRHTAKRIFDRLVAEHGFTGGESTVRRWVRLKKRELGFDTTEAMVPLCPEIGKEAEVDWGTAHVIMNGEQRQVKLFCMRSRYSGKSFVRAYPLERQEMFFEGHIHAFSYFGGIHPVLVYDNLTTAVNRILKGRSRLEQARFVSFRSYYTFKARFCNPGKGHEKGGVEGLVGYSRRNFLVPLPEVKDFDELNGLLIQKCEAHAEKVLPGRPADKNIRLHFEEEKDRLLKLPPAPYDDAKLTSVKATKFQTVRVDRNWYSVPTAYTGVKLIAHVGCWDIRLYYGTKLVAEHPREFGRSEWVLNPYHYLKLLQRKPGAFDEARPILDWRKQWPRVYEHLLDGLKAKHGENKGISEFLATLLLQQEYPEKQVGDAIEKAVSAGAWSSESIKQLLIAGLRRPQPVNPLPEDILPKMMQKGFERPDLSCYDSLLQGVAS
ncbi:MAG: IS21 family transposase [Deltaproteobacteria bacterium]|nr:IS21 family transposase [Deltaproteobacteria bacterium]